MKLEAWNLEDKGREGSFTRTGQKNGQWKLEARRHGEAITSTIQPDKAGSML